jgi:hypothetical protein
LSKNRISKEDFVQFFREDNKSVSKKQINKMERAFTDISSVIKAKINKSDYDENLRQIEKMWEIRDDIDNKRYCLVINKWIGAFVIGKKNGRIQILDFPELID